MYHDSMIQILRLGEIYVLFETLLCNGIIIFKPSTIIAKFIFNLLWKRTVHFTLSAFNHSSEKRLRVFRNVWKKNSRLFFIQQKIQLRQKMIFIEQQSTGKLTMDSTTIKMFNVLMCSKWQFEKFCSICCGSLGVIEGNLVLIWGCHIFL